MNKTISVVILLSLFLANAGAAYDKTSFDVKSRMLNSEKVPVIVVLKDKHDIYQLPREDAVSSMRKHASASQQELDVLLKEEIKKGNADKIKHLWIVNAVAITASPGLIRSLAQRSDVKSIEFDYEYHILEDYSIFSPGQYANATNEIIKINATGVWAFGIDGSGINVSIIDTGIDASHPDIAGRVIKWIDFVNGVNASAYDDNGHGTHVAGTVGGNGNGGITTGVAPNVSLFGAKVLDASGNGSDSAVISGIEWSVSNGADILSLSLGEPNRSMPLAEAINNSINAGVVVIAAAGNSGANASTIDFPGGEKNVITVGAVNSSDLIAFFSSRGPVTIDGVNFIKPDVSAPGVGVTSTVPSGTCFLCDVTGYRALSGTSMATPHVSGSAALLLQAAKKQGTPLSPLQVKSILESTSIDLGIPGKDNIYGAGRINAYAAVLSIDTVSPSVRANPTGYPHSLPSAANGTAIILNATIEDAISGVKNASVDVSAINASLASIPLLDISGSWINSVTVNARDGTYLLNVTSFDNAGNVNKSVRLSVTVNNGPAVFATPGIVRARRATDVTFTVINAGLPVNGATVTLSGLANGTNTTDASGNTLINVNAPATGIINVTATSPLFSAPAVAFITVGGLSALVAPFDTNANGIIDRFEAVNAVVQFFTGTIPRSTAVAVVVAFFTPPF